MENPPSPTKATHCRSGYAICAAIHLLNGLYEVKGWEHADWGAKFPVDVAINAARAADYDALLLPGGVMNPDQLRWNPQAVAFVKEFAGARKPIASICHGLWTLIEVDAIRGRKVTSWPSLRTDLTNAGATWVDEEVIVDNGLRHQP